MSVNVSQYCDSVKTKVVIGAVLALAFGLLNVSQAGPPVGEHAHGDRGWWCPPARAFCPPFNAPKVIVFASPTYFYPSYWSYASAPVAASTSFSNVSPV